jgi:large subunit ribosomal protein L22
MKREEIKDRSTTACLKMIRISQRKLNLISKSIRGLDVGKALVRLSGMRKRAALDVRKLVKSAVANAENNHGLDIDRLKVAQATVGRCMLMKRPDIKGRSRIGHIHKEFSQMRVVLTEEND